MTATSFVTLAPDERRIADFHVVEETGALSTADVLRLVIGGVLFVVGLWLASLANPIAIVVALILAAPGIGFVVQLIVRPHVSEILTVTNERVIHYRRERGRFHDGHAYQNVRVRDISGVTTDHEHRIGGERITIFVHTARADAMLVGAGKTGNLVQRLLQRRNMGPDAARAIRELPALLPSLRAGELQRRQAVTVEEDLA
jgi:hypothetical protein